MWDEWMVDATLYKDDGLFCFVPIENRGTPQEQLVLGMNLLTSIEGFNRGTIVGIIHEAGQEAIDKWVEEHPEIMEELQAKKDADERKA